MPSSYLCGQPHSQKNKLGEIVPSALYLSRHEGFIGAIYLGSANHKMVKSFICTSGATFLN